MLVATAAVADPAGAVDMDGAAVGTAAGSVGDADVEAGDMDGAFDDTGDDTETVNADVAVDTAVVADIVDTAADTAVTASVAAAPPAAVRHDGLSYVFSGGPELLIVLGEISTVGADFEFGLAYDNGFFFSADIGGGIHYIGGGLNAGYTFAGGGHIKNTVGVTSGYRYTALAVNFVNKAGKSVERRVGDNMGFGGIFWKIASDKAQRFNLTNKVVFGYKKDSAWYDRDKHEIYTVDGFSATYYVSIGYVIMKRGK
jgi:hypothetical protein